MNNECELNIGELDQAALDAVTGGDKAVEAAQEAAENKKQADALKAFQQMLQELP